MKKVTLPDLINFLHAQSPADFRGESVEKYLDQNRLELDDFLPFIFFREDTYARNLVFRGEHFELLVLTWLPHQRTPVHDHAGQRCWMSILSGSLTFKTFEPISESAPKLVPHGSPAVHESGGSVYIDDGIGVHCIANPSSKPAISVHLYAAPIERCRIFDESTKTFGWTELEYFTQFEMEWNRDGLTPEPTDSNC